MQLPIPWPVSPMLAKAVPDVPEPDAKGGPYVYEPKWDGFRCIVARDGDEVELGSRGEKPLTRYFPEVVEAVRKLLPERIVIDAEIVVRAGDRGSQKLDWEALAQRIHPAESRIKRLSLETPAEIVAFDLLALGDESLLEVPFRDRRARLETALSHLAPGDPVHLTRITDDISVAREWFEAFEGAGLDGVVAKPLDAVYQPGKRAMLKIKHHRSADVVVYGYRVHKSGDGVGSLLVAVYGEAPEGWRGLDPDAPEGLALIPVGGIVSLPDAMRRALVAELEPLTQKDEAGELVRMGGAPSRFAAAGKDSSFVPLRPDLVVEVAFDQLEGHRFRHAVSLVRWRPDRDPRSCSLDQIDRAGAYDLGQVLVTG
ncbi:MAG: ATP-dependent DNA ligase [Propionibacteriaceae bacterium]